MNDPTSPLRLDDLLEHSQFVRRLARGLAQDEHAADDIAQQTWLSALERPPSSSRNLRSWLAVVARNAAGKSWRSEQSRRRREELAARSEAVTHEGLAERATLQQRIGQLVLELDATYRTPLLLRFYEDRRPRQIAAELDLPVETVRTRIKRGLERVRQRLDREQGGRKAWLALLAPTPHHKSLAANGSSPSNSWVGAPFVVSGGLLLVAVFPFVHWFGGSEGTESAANPSGMISSASLRERRDSQFVASPVIVERNADARSELPSDPIKATPASKLLPLEGRIVDPDGQPREGIQVAWILDQFDRDLGMGTRTEVDQPTTRSNADGWFVLPRIEDPSAVIQVRDADWLSLGRSVEKRRGNEHQVWVVTRRRQLTGRIEDQAGHPIEGAKVHVIPDSARFQDFDRSPSRLDHWISNVRIRFKRFPLSVSRI